MENQRIPRIPPTLNSSRVATTVEDSTKDSTREDSTRVDSPVLVKDSTKDSTRVDSTREDSTREVSTRADSTRGSTRVAAVLAAVPPSPSPGRRGSRRGPAGAGTTQVRINLQKHIENVCFLQWAEANPTPPFVIFI
jgi:hypothetical protein